MWTAFDGQHGWSNKQTIMTAWSGGAFDPVNNQLLIWGGGLGNYRGNEIYAFSVDELKWKRLTDPYHATTNDCMDPFPDNTPMTRHTYDQLAFIDHANRFFVHGGAKNCAGRANVTMDLTWTFDMASNTWINLGREGIRPMGKEASNCEYDPVSQKVYYSCYGSGFYSYNYNTNAWTKLSTKNTSSLTGTIDTKRGLYLEIGKGQAYYYYLRQGSWERHTINASGDGSIVNATAPGMDYDPVSDRIVAWAGGTVYNLNTETWTWTSHSSSGAPSATSNGIYGRWRYVPSVNAFIAATSIDRNVYFYKLTKGGGATTLRSEKMGSLSNFRISPNPMSNVIKIDLPDITLNENASLQIFNTAGQRVQDIPLQKGLIIGPRSLMGLSNGIYIAKMEHQGRVYQTKFVVQK
jgi:hypothetical protein